MNFEQIPSWKPPFSNGVLTGHSSVLASFFNVSLIRVMSCFKGYRVMKRLYKPLDTGDTAQEQSPVVVNVAAYPGFVI